MPLMNRITAQETAMVIVYSIKLYDEEKDKTTSRTKISSDTLRAYSGRERLRTEFVEEWIDELASLGWLAFPVGDAFGLIQAKAVDSWVRIGTKRMRSTLTRIAIGDDDVWTEIRKVVVPDIDFEVTDEE